MRRRGVDSIEEGPILERTSPSNLMLMLDGLNTRRNKSNTDKSRPETKSSTHQRCFNQFDRKTDCFDGSPWALESTDTVRTGLDGVRNPEGMLSSARRFNSVTRLIRATFKTVCGTQTRMPRGLKSAAHGGFRPDRTGLRKTPSSWLPANIFEKTILVPCDWTIGLKESPFLSRGL